MPPVESQRRRNLVGAGFCVQANIDVFAHRVGKRAELVGVRDKAVCRLLIHAGQESGDVDIEAIARAILNKRSA